MRILDQVLGHEKKIQQLLKAYERQRLGSVYLFVGQSGVGKKKVALGLAQALICEKTNTACGICPSCLRVERHQSESLLLIEPQGSQIKVDQAHEILKFLSFKHIGKSSVVVVDQAHLMNQQAANILLKSLEEPAEDVYFILLTNSHSALLPTIRSRGQVVRFAPLSEELVLKKSPHAPLWAVKASRGSIERLTELSHSEDQELRSRSLQILKYMVEDPDFLIGENWRDFMKDRSSVRGAILYWQGILRDALVMQSNGSDEVINVDQIDFVASLSQQETEILLKWSQDILNMEQNLVVNVDAQLQTEKFWIENLSKEGNVR